MKNKKSNLLYVAAYQQPDNFSYQNPARKIGITGGGNSNSKIRMKTLSNGTEAYSPIEAIQIWRFPDNLIVKDEETYLHSMLDILNLRTNREWFNGGEDELNQVERLVELHMQNLITKGLDIIPEHEKINEFDDNHEIISEENLKIKVRGTNRPIPKKATVNGEELNYASWVDLLREIFKYLIDKNKITKDNCTFRVSKGPRGVIMNIIPEYLIIIHL